MVFRRNTENLVFICNPRVVKTYWTISIILRPVSKAVELSLKLRTAYEKGLLNRSLSRYTCYDLLIIAEIVYQETDLLFQLISARYEKHSTIIISNSDLSAWGDIFQNPTITVAMLDGLVHCVHVVKSAGNSYRL